MKEAFEKAKAPLLQASRALNDYVATATSYYPPLEKMTIETAEKIRKFGKDRNICQRLVKSWFRTFLGIKDEAMILITGEIVRSYHIPQHEKFQHERREEAHYYNDKCTLSACSVDGIDYEYRIITEKFGSKSSIDVIADKNQLNSSQLNDLTKKIDELATIIKKAIVSIGGSVKFDLRHCGEIIEAQFQKPDLVIQLKGSSAIRKCSRDQALSTVVEEFDDEQPTITGHRFSSTEACPSRASGKIPSKAKKRRILDDSDTDDETENTDHALPDFGFTASIEDIKRAHAPILVDNCSHVSGQLDRSIIPASKPKEISMTFETVTTRWEYDPSRLATSIHEPLQRKMKFKVFSPNPQTSATKECIITLEVLYPSTAGLTSGLISADFILEAITKALWQTPAESLQKMDSTHVRLWFPRTVQVDRCQYTRGQNAFFSLPSENRIFPVECDKAPVTLEFAEYLSTFCVENGPLDNFQRKLLAYQRLALLATQMNILSHFLFTTLFQTLLGGNSAHKTSIKLILLEESSIEGEALLVNQLNHMLITYLSTRLQSSMCYIRLSTDFGRFSTERCSLEKHFWKLCENLTAFDVSSCTFSCNASMATVCSKSVSFCIRRLNFKNSHMFSYYRLPSSHWDSFSYQNLPGAQWTLLFPKITTEKDLVENSDEAINWDTLVEVFTSFLISKQELLLKFVEILFCQGIQLEEVDFSGCHSRCMLDALLLVIMIINGLRIRKTTLGTPSKIVLRIHGLEHQSGSLSRLLRDTVDKEALVLSNEQLMLQGSNSPLLRSPLLQVF